MKNYRWSLVTLVLFAVIVGVNTSPAQAYPAGCNQWTWPICEINLPSIPRINLGGGRPPLTPKDGPWCRNTYIKASRSGYTYWILTENRKYDLTFWPDYYSRLYQAVYWDGTAWKWVPVNSQYPHVILNHRVNCDA